MQTLIFAQKSAARMQLEHALAARGHGVVATEDVEQAWHLFHGREFGLLVVDWDAEGGNGAFFCRRVQGTVRGSDCIVVALAGGGEALAAGADDCIEKPLSAERLAVRLAVAERQFLVRLDRARMRRALEEMTTQCEACGEPELPEPRHRDRQHVLNALRQANGNRTTASRILGISRATLYRRMADLGLMVRT